MSFTDAKLSWNFLCFIFSRLLLLLSAAKDEFSRLPDVVKYPTVTSGVACATKSLNTLLEYILSICSIEVELFDYDPSYGRLIEWLSNQSYWASTRSFELSSFVNGIDLGYVTRENRPEQNIFFLPRQDVDYRFFYGFNLVSFKVSSTEGQIRQCKSICLRIYTFQGKSIIHQIYTQAKVFHNQQRESIEIFRGYSGGAERWTSVGWKPKRPLDSIILEGGLSERLMSDVEDFLGSKEWYHQRGIPYRRGYLLYGPPGTGKTSMVGAIAGKLGLDIYCLSLSSLDDSTLSRFLTQIPPRSIVLIEDIDATPLNVVNRLSKEGSPDQPKPSGVTLSGLLNALDGIDSSDARVLFVTTNHREHLDPALLRPGRMDLQTHFGLATREQMERLFIRFYQATNNASGSPGSLRLDAGHLSGMDDELWDEYLRERKGEAYEINSTNEGSSKDSGPGTTSTGTSSHGLKGGNPESKIAKLAMIFANSLPERWFSIAALQGYLVIYKSDPAQACANILNFLSDNTSQRKVAASDKDQILNLEPSPTPWRG